MWAITSIIINHIQQSPKPSAKEKIGLKIGMYIRKFDRKIISAFPME